MVFGRLGAGAAHHQWLGSTLDVGVLRNSPGGFLGVGAGLWGLGDADIVDLGLFGTGGFNLPLWTRAGQAQLFVELRVFTRHISASRDNSTAIVGLRLNLKPKRQVRVH